MVIRHVDPHRDAAACAAIYAPSVTDDVASLEELAPDTAEMQRRIVATTATHPWLVAEIGGEIAAYAYAGPHHQRAAYRWTADVTVYTDPDHHRRGIGRGLYEALFGLLAAQGVYEACAGITLPNAASVGLHEALGFVAVGVYRDVAYKLGAWRSVGWWQRSLKPRPQGRAPADPIPPAPPPSD